MPNKHSLISSSDKYLSPIVWGFVLKVNLVIYRWTTPNLETLLKISHLQATRSLPIEIELFPKLSFLYSVACQEEHTPAISVMLRSLTYQEDLHFINSSETKLIPLLLPQSSPIIVLKKKEVVINKLHKSNFFPFLIFCSHRHHLSSKTVWKIPFSEILPGFLVSQEKFQLLQSFAKSSEDHLSFRFTNSDSSLNLYIEHIWTGQGRMALK